MSCTHESIQNNIIADAAKTKRQRFARRRVVCVPFRAVPAHNVGMYCRVIVSDTSNSLQRYPFVALIQLSNNLFWWILPQFDNN